MADQPHDERRTIPVTEEALAVERRTVDVGTVNISVHFLAPQRNDLRVQRSDADHARDRPPIPFPQTRQE